MSGWRLRDHALFADLPEETRRAICDAFVTRDVLAGEVVVTAGDAGGPLHIVETGWLDVLDPDDAGLIAQLGPGALIGELGFLRATPATATVKASTDAVVSTLAAADAVRLARREAAFALAIGRVAAERVHAAPGAGVRPAITAIVRVGRWGRVEAAIAHRLSRSPAQSTVSVHDWPGDGGTPGTPGHLAGTRLLGAALADVRALMIWTDAREPGLSRALRNAGRVVVLAPPDGAVPEALVDHVVATPVDPAVDVVVVSSEAARVVSGVGHSSQARVRAIRLPPDDLVGGTLRELERRGLVGQVLADSPVFAELSRAVRQDLERHLTWRTASSGAVIYPADDAAAGLYLVLSGRVAETRAGDRTDYLPGFVFGDDGLSVSRPTGAHAQAVRDTNVAFVERSALARLYARHEALRAALARQKSAAVARVRSAAYADRASIAVIVPDGDRRWRRRIEQLGAVLGGARRCAVVDRASVEEALGSDVVAARPGTLEDARLRGWLTGLEERHRYLLCVATVGDGQWIARCLGQTDHLLVMAEGEGDPATLPAVGRERARHLALWWGRDARPRGTARWLEADPRSTWHHVRADRFEDLGRMVRRLLGRAIGLVLGGASARGVAHLGVAAALTAADLPIDTIAGTSSGVAVAGTLAMQRPAERAREDCLHIATGFGVGFDNVGPPLVAFFSGRRVCRLCHEIFADQRIEDLLIPLKATALDLRSGETITLDRGPLWLATRASSSIPGLWPPVAMHGRLLVDGGLTDNFPYAVLERECAGGLTVVSNLDAGYATPFEGTPDYGPELSGWRVLVDRLLRRGTVYPELTGTIAECLVLGGRESSAELDDRVDPRRVLVVRPPIPKLAMFALEAGPLVEELIEVARTATAGALAAWHLRYGDGVAYSTMLPALSDALLDEGI